MEHISNEDEKWLHVNQNAMTAMRGAYSWAKEQIPSLDQSWTSTYWNSDNY